MRVFPQRSAFALFVLVLCPSACGDTDPPGQPDSGAVVDAALNVADAASGLDAGQTTDAAIPDVLDASSAGDAMVDPDGALPPGPLAAIILSGPTSVVDGQCAGPYSIELQDSNGTPVSYSGTLYVGFHNLQGGVGNPAYSDANCTMSTEFTGGNIWRDYWIVDPTQTQEIYKRHLFPDPPGNSFFWSVCSTDAPFSPNCDIDSNTLIIAEQ